MWFLTLYNWRYLVSFYPYPTNSVNSNEAKLKTELSFACVYVCDLSFYDSLEWMTSIVSCLTSRALAMTSSYPFLSKLCLCIVWMYVFTFMQSFEQKSLKFCCIIFSCNSGVMWFVTSALLGRVWTDRLAFHRVLSNVSPAPLYYLSNVYIYLYVQYVEEMEHTNKVRCSLPCYLPLFNCMD